MPEKKDGFLKVTWQQIVSAAIGAILLGILGWAGATIKGALEDIEEIKTWQTSTEVLLSTDLKHTIENLNKYITANSHKMGTLSADVKKLEILVNRMEVLINGF